MNLDLEKRWLVLPKITPQAEEALSAFPPVLRQLLFNRGVANDVEARAYLRAELLADSDPLQMTGVPVALDRIHYAIEHAESIAIYGDYDVDGVTATALLVQTIRSFGGEVCGRIPNRFDEGYGLNRDLLSTLKEEGIKVVITVDCGIRSPDEAAHARAIGLDLIITDHHQPADGDLPASLAVINPKQAGDEYPDKDLAGVGVAFKLAQALVNSFPPGTSSLQLDDLLDLVALGTVADLAPLVGENRYLVRKGLRVLQQTKRQGLFSLAAVADLSLSRINASSIGYILGPRLNAAGRLESALAAFDLLTTTDVKKAGNLAQQLNLQNRQRQEITRKIEAEAEAIIQADDPTAVLLFAVHPDFNSGVVGLAASRLVEAYYRPAVVGQISVETNTTRCSCRSIPEFHITQALDKCRDLLIRHGGHAAAAGFTVRNENLVPLRRRLVELATTQLKGMDLRQTLSADMEIALSALTPELAKQLEYFQPTGYGNREPVFVSRNMRIANSRAVGAEGKHLKLVLTDGRVSFDAIGFRLGHLQPLLTSNVDLIYTFETNEFNGRTTLQLNLKDLKPA